MPIPSDACLLDGARTMFRSPALLCAACAVILSASCAAGGNLGVNWGNLASHPLDPSVVVGMLKANNITKVKLFDADSWTVSSLAGSGIELMLAIPNKQLRRMSKDYDNARDWVKKNVTKYLYDGGVDIKYVAVGNEPFLKTYNGSYIKDTFPALRNIQKALNDAGLGDKIKATVPLNADVYNSPDHQPIPSAGDFRSDIRDLMVDIVKFLHANKAPFVVNIYPFLSVYESPDFPIDFAFFEGGAKPVIDNKYQYTNMFDANLDTLVWSLRKAGAGDMKIIVGEAGWPTDGDKNANIKYAKRFYDGFLKKMAANKGTPLRSGPIEVYLFGLLDEDQKSIAPGHFERHWGIFRYDGQPKFPMDLSGKGNEKLLVGAKGIKYLEEQWCVFNKDTKNLSLLPDNMNYACSLGDCTALGYRSSCSNLDAYGNASYAFNMYFQINDQDVRACDFQGLATITTKNASEGTCLFPIQIESGSRKAGMALSSFSVTLTAFLLFAFVFDINV